MHHLIDADGKRLFPPGMRLLSHWNLRDQLKAVRRAAHRDREPPPDPSVKQQLEPNQNNSFRAS